MSDYYGDSLHDGSDDPPPGWKVRLSGWLAVLDRTERPLLGYAIRAALLSTIPALVIGIVLGTIFPNSGPKLPRAADELLFTVVVVAPWLETLLMIPILWVLNRFFAERLDAALASGVVWGVIHALGSVTQGIAVVWTFVVFTTCFQAFDRISRKRAIVATACVHMLHNVVPALALVAAH